MLALHEEAMAGLDPEAIKAELGAADAAFNAEDWDTAIQGYKSLLTKLPMLTNLHMQIGSAYRAKGEYEQAIAAFEVLLAEEPDNSGQLMTPRPRLPGRGWPWGTSTQRPRSWRRPPG